MAEWIRALRSVSSEGAVDHRTAPITAEALWEIAEDPGAEKVARASAAVALDAAGKARLRIAAVATAAPDLCAVLEASAEEASEEQLSQALSRLTPE